jgi:2-succinyl-6-hydroxy-2,4-cyclohexadiene-1-carboxylate synthase
MVESMLIAANGIKYHLEMTGQGPPLLLLHGFTGSVENWQFLLPSFRSRYQVIRLDLIGHGLSEAPREYQRYSLDQAADDLISLLDQLGLKRINLLGYSLGGRLALLFAVKYPERLQMLVIESGSPGLARKSERAARRVADEDLARFIEHRRFC